MPPSPDGFFATTRWTMVRAAGAAAGDALETLCSAYWFPLYAYVRRHGFSKEDAEDLTQAVLQRGHVTALCGIYCSLRQRGAGRSWPG